MNILPRSRAQSHQNKEKFYHNPNSVKTRIILAIEHTCICDRCTAQIEWRKDFRKYKPLKEMRRCNMCSNKTVNRAYHTICEACSRTTGLCAKCNTPCEAASKPKEVTTEMCEAMFSKSSAKERYKRTLQRQWEKGVLSNENIYEMLMIAEEGKQPDWRDYAKNGGAGADDDGDFITLDDLDEDARDMGVVRPPRPVQKKKLPIVEKVVEDEVVENKI